MIPILRYLLCYICLFYSISFSFFAFPLVLGLLDQGKKILLAAARITINGTGEDILFFCFLLYTSRWLPL